jgi:type II secretory pathway pseudopilin PulG
VGLLAVMTILALFALAAAPSVRQQSQREREKETIFRGEQIADAIRDYYIYRRTVLGVPGDQALPTSMDQLLEGVPIPGGTKKRQILRASAARDPLSESGEWGHVAPRSQKLLGFQEDVMLYAGNFLPPPSNNQMRELQGLSAPQLTNVLGVDRPTSAGSNDDLSDDASGPFVGVSSRSSNKSVLYYYGIDQHNRWVFTPLFRQ